MKVPSLKSPLAAKVAAVIAIAAGVVVASILPAQANVQTQSPPVAGVLIQSPATMQAHGAVISLPVVVVCAPAAQTGGLYVEVTQRAGNGIARGFGFLGVSCTGTLQFVHLTIVAQGRAFKAGVAFATAQISICAYPIGCQSATDQREIRIVH